MHHQIVSITIRDKQVVLHFADSHEVVLSIGDMLFVQGWIHDNHVQLLELLYQPPEKMFNATQALAEQEKGREQML